MPAAETLHASCVVVGESGILIRGASGAGKSTLARRLVHEAGHMGRFAAHVADDRTRLEVRGGRLLAAPVPAIAGLLEVRGLGLVSVPFETRAVVRLLVDVSEGDPTRLPAAEEGAASLCGIAIRRLALRSGTPGTDLIVAWVDQQELTLVTV